MPSAAIGRALLIFLSYLAVAAAFTWPLPLHLSSALPGSPEGDTAVYVWNLWAFAHAVANGTSPFVTRDVAVATGEAVPLVLHNYTAFTNLLGLPLIGAFGVVATYNVLILVSHALSASGMYLLARHVSRDRAAAWFAGLLFGFAPFAIARSMGHFSLVQTAPLPIFVWLVLRLAGGRSWRNAAAAGGVAAWAYYCDPYYAVYCGVILLGMLAYGSLTVTRGRGHSSRALLGALDAMLVLLGAVVAIVVMTGGGSFAVAGLRISMRSLYTPMLVLEILLLLRIALAVRPRVSLDVPPAARDWRNWAACGLTGLVLVAPVALALVAERGTVMGPEILWRSSAPGVDVAALLLPNPLHPLAPESWRTWLWSLPQGLVENVASIPWTAIVIILAAALIWRIAVPRAWMVWTFGFGLIALGPFVHVAGHNLALPGPWALLRFAPVIGAARVPTRFSILVVLGLSVLAAIALAAIRRRTTRPAAVAALAVIVAFFELLPAPRALHAAAMPSFVEAIAGDARPLRVLNLPFGLRDGLTSYGRFSPVAMFLQTAHEKPIMGAYVSRLPADSLESGAFAESRVPHALIALSAGEAVAAEDAAALTRDGRTFVERTGIGWVIVDRSAASVMMESMVVEALGLRLVASDERFALYEPVR